MSEYEREVDFMEKLLKAERQQIAERDAEIERLRAENLRVMMALSKREDDIERLRAALDAEAESSRMLQERVNRLVEGSKRGRIPEELLDRLRALPQISYSTGTLTEQSAVVRDILAAVEKQNG